MVDDLDEYIEDREQSKSAALRDLLDLGLQAEAAGVEPAELEQRIDDLTEEREELEQEINKLLEEKLAGGLVTVGVLLGFAAAGISSVVGGVFPGVAPQVTLAVQLIASLLLVAGLIAWSWVLGRPFLQPVVGRLKTLTSD